MKKYLPLLLSIPVLVILSLLIIWLMPNGDSQQKTNKGAVVSVEKPRVRPDPFPSPAKTNAKLYTIYTVGDIQFDVSPLQVNMTNDLMHGPNSFQIDYYNSASTDIRVADTKSIDIGCVATNDGKYVTVKEQPDMFTRKVSRGHANSAAGIGNLPAWQHVKITIEVHPSCKYVGTADLAYSWLVK